MQKLRFFIIFLMFNQLFANQPLQLRASSIPQVHNFIDAMVHKHNFKKRELEYLFKNVLLSVKKPVKKNENTPKKPHHKITWDKFAKIFLTKQRIESGAKFLKDNYKTLQKAEDKFGVQKAIIVAILGIETNYGTDTGKYPTMQTLTALGFGKNRRQQFYKNELEQFLIMARKNGIAPLSVNGSHAGAMGISQFISSSYNHYAIDFNNDGKVDLFNVEDAIGSVANYFAQHSWQKGGKFAIPVHKKYQKFAKFATNKPKIKPKIHVSSIPNNTKIAFIMLTNDKKIETWATFWNFYVITRYNHDNKYAMATIKLAQEIINKSLKTL